MKIYILTIFFVLNAALSHALEKPEPLTLIGLTIDDEAARYVIEHHTLVHKIKTVKYIGSIKTTDWVLDRPPLAATLARHLHPPLENYRISAGSGGNYTVEDLISLKGTIRLVARGANARVYFIEGSFRSKTLKLKLSGNMVFTLEYKEHREGSESYVEVEPHIYVRFNNVVVHGITKVFNPLLHRIIDRRAATLATAAQVVSERLTKDPHGLYEDMKKWSDIGSEDIEEYRIVFLAHEEIDTK
ncbi:MAG: hypothetical protein HY097_02040 [Nitrospinae bacterium]|nr:hypothetical protein [Nitrospinota bacterium]